MRVQTFLKTALLTIAIGGCSLIDPRSAVDEVSGLFPVQLGESYSDIVERLGDGGGTWTGDCLCWGLEYQDGPYARMRLTFPEAPGKAEPLRSISVRAPYDRSTSNGLRLGLPQEEVHNILGSPDSEAVGPTDNVYDRYTDGRRGVSISYGVDGLVDQIGLGMMDK